VVLTAGDSFVAMPHLHQQRSSSRIRSFDRPRQQQQQQQQSLPGFSVSLLSRLKTTDCAGMPAVFDNQRIALHGHGAPQVRNSDVLLTQVQPRGTACRSLSEEHRRWQLSNDN